MLNYIFFFSLGAVLASFLNLCVYRLEKDFIWQKIFLGKSLCDNCGKNLGWYELIPIFSFIFLKGKCSSCKSKIPIINFFSEIFLGLSFLLLYLTSSPIIFFIFLPILYFWAVSDLQYQSIPKRVTDIVLLVSIVFWISSLIYEFDLAKIYPVLLSILIALIVYAVSFKKKIFGLGDVIVFFILAFWFKLEIFVSVLLYSIILGGIFGLILSIKDKKFLKGYIPFLPFILLGFLFNLVLESRGIPLFDYILPLW